MCGITGITFNTENEERVEVSKALFKNLLVKTEVHGPDATGVMVINKIGDTIIGKAPVKATDFVKTDQYNKIMDMVNKDTLAVVGHCRQSTQGDASNNTNNHPHYCRQTISVHNGHITAWKKFAEKWRLKLNSGCDSELFPFAYNFFRTKLKWSKTRTLKYFCEEVKPTGVFVFYSDLDPNHLSILKLADRFATIKPILKNGEKAYIFNTTKDNINKAITATSVFKDFLVTTNPEEESTEVNSLIEFSAPTIGNISVYHQSLKTVK